jgi:AraC-like DNA-binding protein
VRLWELTEHALQDPCAGLTAVSRHQVGDLDLYDYLFATAGTVREALEITGDFFRLITTNCQLRAGAPADAGITYTYRHALPGGRGEELWTQFSIGGFCARIQAVAGHPVIPAHIAFAQPPPRSHRAFTETFGTRHIDFRAPATTFTLLDEDLDRPIPSADPVLGRILRRYAATLPLPQPTSWHSYFREVLAEAIGDGAPSLDSVARRLAVSIRTLQRRLAEHGTTWRAELETARQDRAHQAFQASPPSMIRLARELGYADPRSVRRALRRWDDHADHADHAARNPDPDDRSR